jgi:hypothetical protein
MKVKTNKTVPSARPKDLPGYPAYPAGDDIYKKYKEEDVNPEEISRKKESETKKDIKDADDIDTPVSGSDLDIPGAELDDIQENIGSEDEENNYYSLGGDDHNDLEEDKGE